MRLPAYGSDISKFVTPNVEKAVHDKFAQLPAADRPRTMRKRLSGVFDKNVI